MPFKTNCMKQNNYSKIVMLIFVFHISIISLYAQNSIYELSIAELKAINIKPDSASNQYLPTYEITIKDLMSLEIVKELRVEKYIDFAYDIPLSELMLLKIPISREHGIDPSYDMSIKGLTELEIKETTNIVDRINLNYDISLDGIMHIEIRKMNDKK